MLGSDTAAAAAAAARWWPRGAAAPTWQLQAALAAPQARPKQGDPAAVTVPRCSLAMADGSRPWGLGQALAAALRLTRTPQKWPGPHNTQTHHSESGCLHRIRKVQANFQVTEVRRSMAIPFKMPFDVTGS